MMIVDSQVHIWSQGTPLGAHRPTSSFTVDELLAEMDQAGVNAAIIHPPAWDPHCMQVAADAVRTHPGRFAILGHVPLDQPESAAALPSWLAQPGMLGLRYALVRASEEPWPWDGTMDWLWPLAARLRIPVALQAARFLPQFRQVAEQYPELRLIIDHCGLPRFSKDEAAFADLGPLLSLARLPNVAVKLSGAPAYSSMDYPYRNIHDGLRRIYDAFGPHRVFWGTDITRMPCSYRQCVTMFTEELSWLRGDDLALVMGGAVCAWLGFQPMGVV